MPNENPEKSSKTESYRLFFNDRKIVDAAKIESIAWSDDGKRYEAHCTTENRDKFMIIDGKKVFEYAEDAQPLEARNDGRDLTSNRQGTNYGLLSGNTIVSPDGKHSLSLAKGDTRIPNGPAKAVCLDGALIPCENEHSEVAAFFTPDSKHVVWVDWGDSYHGSGYSVYVDGQREAHYDGSKITKDALEMGPDGVLTLIAQVGNAVKKLRVIPSPDTNLSRFAAIAEEHQLAAQVEPKEPVEANW